MEKIHPKEATEHYIDAEMDFRHVKLLPYIPFLCCENVGIISTLLTLFLCQVTSRVVSNHRLMHSLCLPGPADGPPYFLDPLRGQGEWQPDPPPHRRHLENGTPYHFPKGTRFGPAGRVRPHLSQEIVHKSIKK